MKQSDNKHHVLAQRTKLLFLLLIMILVAGITMRQLISTPSLTQNQKVRSSPDICVHSITGPINGAMVLLSYPCDKVPDWSRLEGPMTTGATNPERLEDIYVQEGVLDIWTTPECPIVSFEKSRIDNYGVIIVEQDKVCKLFSHNFPEPILQHVIVNTNGKFEVRAINGVTPNKIEGKTDATEIITDCPYSETILNHTHVKKIQEVFCLMVEGFGEYSNPNLVALYKIQDPTGDKARWYIEVFEQNGKTLYPVFQDQNFPVEEDVNIALYRDGRICILNDSGLCRLAGIITHSPPQTGLTNESGYKITWKP